MTVYTPTIPSIGVPTFTPQPAAAGGDSWNISSGSVYLLMVFSGATGATVTLDDPRVLQEEGATVSNPDVAIVVPANAFRAIPVQGSRFVNPATGQIAVTYSQVTTVTVAMLGPLPRAI